jgi:hypothetical protein
MRSRSFDVEYFQARRAYQQFAVTTDVVPVPIRALHTKAVKILLQEVRRLMKAHKIRSAFNRVSKYIRRETDRILRLAEKEHGKIEVACDSSFCIQCCRRPIYIRQGLEERAVAGALRSMPDDLVAKVLKRVEHETALLDEAAKIFGFDGKVPPEDQPIVDGEYSRMGGMCPMMEGSGTCLLRGVKPFSCQMVLVIGKPCQMGAQAESIVFPHLLELLDQAPIAGPTIALMDVIRLRAGK